MVELFNKMDYRVDVDGVVGTYHSNMLKQYIERKNVTSNCLLSAEANITVYDVRKTSQSIIFQSCRNGNTVSWVLLVLFWRYMYFAQGYNTAT